jgi:two-component system chemotaxis sensor kinase CheA
MYGEDEEILQDFLVEAGEILEQLSEQLVDLEQSPEDHDLLNAIFRGFHTVKGGAGFLQLEPLVDCCHVTENLFDILRNGKRSVTPDLMDVVLQSLDTVNAMFDQVQNREAIDPAPPELLSQLNALVECKELESEAVSAEAPVTTAVAEPVTEATAAGESAAANNGDITDQEFEQFLDAVADPEKGAEDIQAPVLNATPAASDTEISDDEFEALLDQIHGAGQHGGAVVPITDATPSKPDEKSAKASDEITDDEFEDLLNQLHGDAAPGSSATSSPEPVPAATTGGGDTIDDDEFEALLDQLHGQGKSPNADAKAGAGASAVEKAPTEKAIEPAAAEPAAASPAVITKPQAPAKPVAKKPANKEAPAAETTVRVDTQRLDDIMNMVGELVLVRNRLVRLGSDSGDEVMSKAVSNLDVVTADLQMAVMKTRMQPIKKVFGRFPRVVRDLARNLKKEITLELQGEDTDLDKNLVEALADPLVHLVRNSVDHGIEMPDVRESNGKPRTGKVILAAEQEGDHILLSITDDGGGMDPDKLRGIAVNKGLMDEDSASRLSDTECFNLIFMPGFSTKTEISDVSGRGVGMDVVKTKISQLNGSVEIQSELGKGTRLEIKVPLTLAIMPTLMIMLGDQTFALPLASVNEIFHMDLTRTNIVDGQEVVTVRDKSLPMFYLKQWLVPGAPDKVIEETAHVVIVTVGTQRIGFVVDQLIGQEEVVIKPLGNSLQGTPGLAGATITGDGRIALILDVPSLLKHYAH